MFDFDKTRFRQLIALLPADLGTSSVEDLAPGAAIRLPPGVSAGVIAATTSQDTEQATSFVVEQFVQATTPSVSTAF